MKTIPPPFQSPSTNRFINSQVSVVKFRIDTQQYFFFEALEMHRRLFHGTPPVLMARLSRSRLTAVVVNSNANITNNNENTTAVQNHKDTSFSHNGQSAWSVVEAVKPMKAPSQQTPSRPPSQRLQKAVANDILSKLFKSERVKKKDDIDDNNSILEKSSSPTAVLDIDNQSTLSPSTDPPPDKKLKESVENTSSSLSASTSHSKGLNKAELDQEEEKRSLHHTASETVKQLYAFEQEDEMHGSIRRSEVDTTSVTPAWYEGAIFNAPPHRQQLEEKSGNKFVPRWMRNTQQQQQDDDDEEEVMEEEDSIIGQTLPALQLKSIIKLVNENYGSNTAVIDVRSRSDTFDYIIITEGRSTKQLYSIADAVKRYVKTYLI